MSVTEFTPEELAALENKSTLGRFLFVPMGLMGR